MTKNRKEVIWIEGWKTTTSKYTFVCDLLFCQLTYCMVCKEANDEDLLVYCDGCDNAYHTYCMVYFIF